MIQITDDFYNKLATDIKANYFKDETLYSENKNYHHAKYAIELFNNGMVTYCDLIKKLARRCKDSTIKIHEIVKKYISYFDGYEYKP